MSADSKGLVVMVSAVALEWASLFLHNISLEVFGYGICVGVLCLKFSGALKNERRG